MTAARAPILMIESIAAGEPIAADALEYLRISCGRIMRGDAPTDVCLRITMGNRIDARNSALIRAAQIVDAGRGQSAWHLAELVRQAVNRFETVIIPRIQRGDAGELSPLDAALRDAFASGAKPLTSQQRIYDELIHAFNQPKQ